MSMNFFNSIVILNLLLLISIQLYDDFQNRGENPIEKFTEMSDHFKKSWNKFSKPKHKGSKIFYKFMYNFFKDLEGDLALDSGILMNDKLYIIFLLDLNLIIDSNKYFYFHDVLMKVIKYRFGKNVSRYQMVKKYEQILMKKIIKRIDISIMNEFKNERVKIIFYNPITSHLYLKGTIMFLKMLSQEYLNQIKRENLNSEENELEQQ